MLCFTKVLNRGHIVWNNLLCVFTIKEKSVILLKIIKVGYNGFLIEKVYLLAVYKTYACLTHSL